MSKLNHRVLDSMRHSILTNVWSGGSAVSVKAVAEDLTVSSAPVRDALIRLSERGLVDHLGNRGFFIARPTRCSTLYRWHLFRTILHSASKGGGHFPPSRPICCCKVASLSDAVESWVCRSAPQPMALIAVGLADYLCLAFLQAHGTAAAATGLSLIERLNREPIGGRRHMERWLYRRILEL